MILRKNRTGKTPRNRMDRRESVGAEMSGNHLLPVVEGVVGWRESGGPMTRDEFVAILARDRAPVVLVEGTRDLPDAQRPRLTAFAERLATAFPLLRFRTGNAEGSDEAFAEGVCRVDPKRLEYVVPHDRMRQTRRHPASYHVSLGDVPRE